MNKVRLALLGFGNAGQAFAQLLLDTREDIKDMYQVDPVVTAIATGSRGCLVDPSGLELSRILELMRTVGSLDSANALQRETNALKIAEEAAYDVLIEMTPLEIFTGQPAINHIEKALIRKKHAITANKGPIAWDYRRLADLAKEQGVGFYFETTVMDGTPIFNLVEETLPFCTVTRVEGILNSTTNFLLEEMAKGTDADIAMEKGRKMGFVEADPAMDVLGWDAAAKTAALLNVLMDAGITPDQIDRTGIDGITKEEIEGAKERGTVIKLLCRGFLEDGKVIGKVAPEEIRDGELLSTIRGTTSVIRITTDRMGALTIIEEDPTILQTGFGIFGDLIRVLKNHY